MRRSTLAVVLAALVASLVSLTSGVASGVPYEGEVAGAMVVSPADYFEGSEVKLTADYATDARGLVVTFFAETSPGSNDYTDIGTDQAGWAGNASVLYTADDDRKVFARTSAGKVTPRLTLEPQDPAACTQSGTLTASPSFIPEGSDVKLIANFPNDQALANVTFFTQAGDTLTPIGSDAANSSGNAYLLGHQVDAEQVVVAYSSKGKCTPTLTLTPTVIQPESFTQTGVLTTDPTSIREGRTGTIIANFPTDQALVNVTVFQLKGGVWEAVGQDQANSSGNAYITGHKFDGTETLFAATSTGQRTDERAIETIPPNVVTGGPAQLGKNVIYVTTDNARMPVTKGVAYKGKAVIGAGDTLTETLDIDEIAVRGNNTADKAKKPYKLKFEDKQQPFGMKSDKTWILLANYGDRTLIRSMVAWDLGQLLVDGLKWTPDSRFAELFINGKYLGSYQMVQSIKIDKNRVNVSKTTGQIIEFDPHWKEDGLPGMIGRTGVNYAWKDPDEFKTLGDGTQDPEGLTTAKISKMKAKIRAFEDVLYAKNWATVNYATLAPEDDWQTYLDLNSAVDYYLAREFTKDNDADMYRSNFFYTNNVDPASPDKFFMGPIWDFDRSAGAKNPSDTSVHLPTGWWMRGNGSPDHDTNKIHWYTRITDDPRFLKALHDRWDLKKAAFDADAPEGVQAAVTKLGGGTEYDLGLVVAENDRIRWKGYGGRYATHTPTYPGEIAWVTDWYAKRFTWMDGELVKAPPPIS